MNISRLVLFLSLHSWTHCQTLQGKAKSIPIDPIESRLRCSLQGEFSFTGNCKIIIIYQEQTNSFELSAQFKNRNTIRVFLGDSICATKLINHKNHCYLLLSRQEKWSGFWPYAVLDLAFAESGTCDVRWLLVADLNTDNSVSDIAVDKNHGICVQRNISRISNFDTGEVLSEGLCEWYALQGADLANDFSKLKMLPKDSFLEQSGVKSFETAEDARHKAFMQKLQQEAIPTPPTAPKQR